MTKNLIKKEVRHLIITILIPFIFAVCYLYFHENEIEFYIYILFLLFLILSLLFVNRANTIISTIIYIITIIFFITLLIKITEIKEKQIFLPFYILVAYIEFLFLQKILEEKFNNKTVHFIIIFSISLIRAILIYEITAILKVPNVPLQHKVLNIVVVLATLFIEAYFYTFYPKENIISFLPVCVCCNWAFFMIHTIYLFLISTNWILYALYALYALYIIIIYFFKLNNKRKNRKIK